VRDRIAGLRPLKNNATTPSYVEECKKYGPSRAVNNAMGNVITHFPSLKSKKSLPVESLIELNIALLLELDSAVKWFGAQARPVMVKRWNKKGYEYQRNYTPDHPGVNQLGAEFVIEGKAYDQVLVDLSSDYPRFRRLSDGTIEDPAAKAVLAERNVHHLIVTEKDFGPQFYTNACLLAGYVGRKDPNVNISERILELLAIKGISTIERLALDIEAQGFFRLDREQYLQCLNWLLVSGRIYADLNNHSLQALNKFEVYSTRSLARTRIQDRNTCLSPEPESQQLDLKADAVIRFAGENYSVVGSQKGKVYLKDDNGVTRLFDLSDLERHFHAGELTSSHTKEGAILTPFAKADERRQKRAIKRVESVALYEQGIKTIQPRTYYHYKKLMNEARISFGCGLSGLVGEINPGNRTDKICSRAKDYVRHYIAHSYLGLKPSKDLEWSIPKCPSRENSNKVQAWAHYKKCAAVECLHAVSYVTFTRAIKRISRHLSERQKAGSKAAYQAEFPLSTNWSGATHGQFAGHIVEIDHTLTDLSIVDEDSFGLGRMWLTVAIDTYSRMVVGYNLSFWSPSRRSVMMTIRDIVKRNGYLPMCMSLDGGKEFHSVYIDQLLARYRVQKRCRPPHRSRYGAIVERFFGTINKDFWHNLLGSTRLMVNPRNVAKEFIAKNRAIWGVEEIKKAFDDYIDQYNSELIHSSLGMTPKKKHDGSYSNLLPIQKRQVKYDDSFEICTMLEPKNNKELKCRRGGLHSFGGRYSHPVLRKQINQGVKFAVKYDPTDLRHLYFAHDGIWKTAKLTGGVFSDALSESEIQILSDVEAAKHKGKYQQNLSRLFKKAESVVELQETEYEIKMRRAIADRETLELSEEGKMVVSPEKIEGNLNEEPEAFSDAILAAPSGPIRTGIFDV